MRGAVCGFAAYQVSSHNQSIAEHFKQKCRALSTALYILFPPNSHDIEECVCVCVEVIRDVFLAFDLQRVRMRSEVDRTTCTTHLATDGAQAELIRHRRAGLGGETTVPQWQLSLCSTGIMIITPMEVKERC